MDNILTGATGFVGSAVALELLSRTKDAIIGIVRAVDDDAATARLRTTLHELIGGYNLDEQLHDAVEHRVSALAGDVTLERCGVNTLAINQFKGAVEFWHCAASLKFQDRHRAEIETTNVNGTANVLALAGCVSAHRFNSVSTAYVAGSRAGLIPAEPARSGQENNLYERSKIAAEQLVMKSGLTYRILRPGVVIGHSATRHTTSDDGMYGFLRNLIKYARVLDRTRIGLASDHEASLVASPKGNLDLVPVDHVAADAVGLASADAPQGIYHLTNPNSTEIKEVLDVCFDTAGFPPPRCVEQPDGLCAVDRKLYERMSFYNSYLVNPKTFDRSTVEAVLGHRAMAGKMLDRNELESLCAWYVDYNQLGRQAVMAQR